MNGNDGIITYWSIKNSSGSIISSKSYDSWIGSNVTSNTVLSTWTPTAPGTYTVSYTISGYESTLMLVNSSYQYVYKAKGTGNTYSQTIVVTNRVNCFEISFYANGGSGTMATQNVAEGKNFTLPFCSFTAPEGKQFKAWSVNGTECAAGTSFTPTGDVTIIAVWDKIREPSVQMRKNVATLVAYIKANGIDDGNGNKQITTNTINGLALPLSGTETITYVEASNVLRFKHYADISDGKTFLTRDQIISLDFDAGSCREADALIYREETRDAVIAGYFTYIASLDAPTYQKSGTTLTFSRSGSSGTFGRTFGQDFSASDGNNYVEFAVSRWDDFCKEIVGYGLKAIGFDAYDNERTIRAGRTSDGSIQWQISGGMFSGEGMVVISTYDADGKMLDIKTTEVSNLLSGASGNAKPVMRTGGFYKIYLLDSQTLAPLTEAFTGQ